MKAVQKALAVVLLSSMSAGLAVDIAGSAQAVLNKAQEKAGQATEYACAGITNGYAYAKDACVHVGRAGYDKVAQAASLAQIKAAVVVSAVTALASRYRKELSIVGLATASGLGYAGYRYYQAQKTAKKDSAEAEVVS